MIFWIISAYGKSSSESLLGLQFKRDKRSQGVKWEWKLDSKVSRKARFSGPKTSLLVHFVRPNFKINSYLCKWISMTGTSFRSILCGFS